MDNYDITRFQLGMKDKAVDCFPLRSFFQPLLRNQEQPDWFGSSRSVFADSM